MAADEWQGITYPFIFDNRVVLFLWKHLACPQGWHLLDEVFSQDSHYLSCDACGIEFVGQWLGYADLRAAQEGE